MIVGLGLDLVEIDRIQESLRRFGPAFEDRILTGEEIAAAPSVSHARVRYVAARFAVKEAASKALGTGFSQGVTFKNISVRKLDSGAPELVLDGPALDQARQLGADRFHVSITHGRDTAAAVVILERS